MAILQNKIDFAAIVSVTRANINGDPLNGNRPREDYDGYGIFSDVAIKRKIRNRLQDMGEYIFVQTDGREDDRKHDSSLKENYRNLKDRAASDLQLAAEIKKGKDADTELFASIACKKWIDVRAFGQVFAFKKDTKKAKGQEDENGSQLSVGVRGPVSIQQAISADPIEIIDMQITKSVNAEAGKSGKASDTMGMKHRVDKGTYVFYGSISPQLASTTGFSEEDAALLKDILPKMFENDASSARPDGSMRVLKVIWWKHSCFNGDTSSARVHESLKVDNDGNIELVKADKIPEPEIIEGF